MNYFIYFTSLFFLFGASLIGSLPIPSFDKISVALSSGITFLVRAVCFPSPHEENKETACPAYGMFFFVRQGAGNTVLCKPALSISLSFTFLKLFIYI